MGKGAGWTAAKLSTMQPVNGLSGRLSGPGALGTLSGRHRRLPPDSNGHFVLAFADALRDILREERRRAA